VMKVENYLILKSTGKLVIDIKFTLNKPISQTK